jgi:hypothetical protein
MKRISTLALLALLPTIAVAQQSDPKMEWNRFLAANGPAWAVNWNPATGTPDAIYGEGLATGDDEASLESGRKAADGLLVKYAALLGKGNSDFVLLDSSQIRHLLYFVYGQRYKGLEVRGGRADVRINTNGVIAMFGSSAVRIPAGFKLEPAITAAAARRIAEQKALGRAGLPGRKTRLVIWAQPSSSALTKPVLAWEVDINELPTSLDAGKSFVDAMTGAVLEFENGIIYCSTCEKNHMRYADGHAAKPAADAIAKRDALVAAKATVATVATVAANSDSPPLALTGTVMAWVITGHKPTDTPKNVPLPNLFVTSSAGSATTDSKGKFTIPYTGTTNVTVTATLAGKYMKRIRVASGTRMSASASVSPTTAGTIQFGTVTMSELLKSQTTVYYFTDDVNRYVRSLVPNKPTQFRLLDGIDPRVNINSSCNAYYTNYTINFYNKSTTCNMTAYETVVQHEWGHAMDTAFGGLNTTDGLSEGWSDVLCILRSQQPEVGPAFFLTRNPAYVRIATNSLTYPQSGAVHTKGQVWMGWVWDVRTDLAKRLGVPAAQIITEKIVIPTIVANAASLQRQVLEVFLLDDNDGNLANGTPNYNALEKASIKRKIVFPKINAGFMVHKPLPNTELQLTPSIVRAKAIPIIGSFTKVELTYDIGAGPVTLAMVPSGTKDEYIALIPGVLSPKTTKYHVTGTHSTSKIFQLPPTGDYDFATGKEVTFLSDDFEGTNTWTTGGTRSDWALGTPTGASGNTANTNWADPKGAFSGNKSWGNNLAGQYNTNMVNAYIRSPKIDLRGKTNVRLRYYRWLTSMQGAWDKAEIFVGTTKEWANEFAKTTVENSWSKQDIRLTSADNKKDVQVEFRMSSDGDFQLGGWNVDDVAVYAFEALPAPKFTMDINPSMVGLGKSSTATFSGTASKPILILVSTSRGPTNIPSLPTLHVGTPFLSVPAALNSSGKLVLNFNAPTNSSATGMVTFVHALEQTSATTLTASNAGVILWGK